MRNYKCRWGTRDRERKREMEREKAGGGAVFNAVYTVARQARITRTDGSERQSETRGCCCCCSLHVFLFF